MLVRFTKATQTKPYVLTCVRDDGSATWQQSSAYFVWHDLMHYAVETTLGYRAAFLGLVAAGRGLDDFGTREGRRDIYTAEEAWAEGIVGLLQWPISGGGPALSDEELVEQLDSLAFGPVRRMPAITSEQVVTIRNRIAELHGRWAEVPAGGTMEVVF